MNDNRVIQWMNVLRDLLRERSIREAETVLECFWASQIVSKREVMREIAKSQLNMHGNVYVFGGWYGLLAQMIADAYPQVTTVYSVDINPMCAVMGKKLCGNDPRIRFMTMDMAEFGYNEYYELPFTPRLIVNTSTEHVTQETFDKWKANLPARVPVILQGNNYYKVKDHIRCTDSVEEFIQKNSLNALSSFRTIDCGEFDRYMLLGWM
jgi:hypothetical protein